jgi:hypothetical protein
MTAADAAAFLRLPICFEDDGDIGWVEEAFRTLWRYFCELGIRRRAQVER